MRHPIRTLALLSAAALALAACGRKGDDTSNIAAPDNGAAAGNGADAALSNELANQIAVDADLVGNNAAAAAPSAGGDTKPAAAAPASADAAADAGDGAPGCHIDVKFAHGKEWAQRLPATFPVYPGAQVTDAAGNDTGHCRMRVVTFASGDNWERVLDWYNTQAVRAGYSSEHQIRDGDHILGGTKGDDAYYLTVTPTGSGSTGAITVNNGR
jgi:hypothetical protein